MEIHFADMAPCKRCEALTAERDRLEKTAQTRLDYLTKIESKIISVEAERDALKAENKRLSNALINIVNNSTEPYAVHEAGTAVGAGAFTLSGAAAHNVDRLQGQRDRAEARAEKAEAEVGRHATWKSTAEVYLADLLELLQRDDVPSRVGDTTGVRRLLNGDGDDTPPGAFEDAYGLEAQP